MLYKDKINTKERLKIKCMSLEYYGCIFCSNEIESGHHLFFKWTYTKLDWFCVSSCLVIISNESMERFASGTGFCHLQRGLLTICQAWMWLTWTYRNQILFRDWSVINGWRSIFLDSYVILQLFYFSYNFFFPGLSLICHDHFIF